MNNQTETITALVERIKPLLAGHPPDIQGAALADCLAIWLAGHHVAGDREATSQLRAGVLAEHIIAVDALVAVNAMILGTTT
jgi:hypothetical protein